LFWFGLRSRFGWIRFSAFALRTSGFQLLIAGLVLTFAFSRTVRSLADSSKTIPHTFHALPTVYVLGIALLRTLLRSWFAFYGLQHTRVRFAFPYTRAFMVLLFAAPPHGCVWFTYTFTFRTHAYLVAHSCYVWVQARVRVNVLHNTFTLSFTHAYTFRSHAFTLDIYIFSLLQTHLVSAPHARSHVVPAHTCRTFCPVFRCPVLRYLVSFLDVVHYGSSSLLLTFTTRLVTTALFRLHLRFCTMDGFAFYTPSSHLPWFDRGRFIYVLYTSHTTHLLRTFICRSVTGSVYRNNTHAHTRCSTHFIGCAFGSPAHLAPVYVTGCHRLAAQRGYLVRVASPGLLSRTRSFFLTMPHTFYTVRFYLYLCSSTLGSRLVLPHFSSVATFHL